MKKRWLKVFVTAFCLLIAFFLCFNVHVFASDVEVKGLAFDIKDVTVNNLDITKEEVLELSGCWITRDGVMIPELEIEIYGMDEINDYGSYKLDIYAQGEYVCSINLVIEEEVVPVEEPEETNKVTVEMEPIRVVTQYGEYYIDEKVMLNGVEYDVVGKNETKLLGKKYTVTNGDETFVVYPKSNIYMSSKPNLGVIALVAGLIGVGVIYNFSADKKSKEYKKYRM